MAYMKDSTGRRLDSFKVADTDAVNAADARVARWASSLFRGMQPIASRGANLGSGSLSTSGDTAGMYRIAHRILTPTADVRLVYVNWYGAAGSALGDGLNPITVKASLDTPVPAPQAARTASNFQVTFDNGSPTKTIAPGGVAVSDPVPLTAFLGEWVYENVYVTVATGGRWPLGQQTLSANAGISVNYYEGGATGTSVTDVTASGTVPTGYVGIYGAVAIVGSPQDGVAAPPSWFNFGDSITFGANDAVIVNDGWMGRACLAAGIAYMNMAHPGEQASHVQGTGMRQRLPLASACTKAVVGYGRNDLANIAGITLATFQGYAIFIWRSLAARGLDVYQTTITPLTASTDGFITTANQTPAPDSGNNGYNTKRSQFNAWLRDGAPVNASTFAPLATGSASGSTVLRIGAAAHPLAGFIEVADVVETARDSAVWKQGRVVTDASFTSGSRVVTSATAAFTSADYGAAISVPGVGMARIGVVASATQVTYEGAGPAGSTMSNQTIGIGYYTNDGTHPTPSGHKAIAATVDAAAL